MIREAGSEYTDDENILVLELFMRLDYRQFRVSNPQIIELSGFFRQHGYDRSPGSVKAKLENLKAVNPEYTRNGRVGLPGVCQFLRDAWADYESTGFETLTADAGEARMRISNGAWVPPIYDPSEDVELGQFLMEIPDGRERQAMVSVRVNQGVFRRRVLASFGGRCCITGIRGDSLLVASHIKPWNSCKGDLVWQRIDPGNGLCLNALHDRAFDRGLFTLDEKLRVELSSEIGDYLDDTTVNTYFRPFEGRPIDPPTKARIKFEYVEYHRDHVFIL